MAAEKKMATRTFGGTLQIRVRARSDTKVTASNVNDFLLLVEAASWKVLVQSPCSDAVEHHVCE